jgi:hypothetical protein
MRPVFMQSIRLSLVGHATAEDHMPVVNNIASALQSEIQFVNPRSRSDTALSISGQPQYS